MDTGQRNKCGARTAKMWRDRAGLMWTILEINPYNIYVDIEKRDVLSIILLLRLMYDSKAGQSRKRHVALSLYLFFFVSFDLLIAIPTVHCLLRQDKRNRLATTRRDLSKENKRRNYKRIYLEREKLNTEKRQKKFDPNSENTINRKGENIFSKILWLQWKRKKKWKQTSSQGWCDFMTSWSEDVSL